MFSRVSLIEIGERHAVGSLVCELIRGRKKRIEIRGVIGERRRPEEPVQFRVLRSRIERQTVSILLRLIEDDLRTGHFWRKQVQTQQLVPDEIIFLAPRTRLVEC